MLKPKYNSFLLFSISRAFVLRLVFLHLPFAIFHLPCSSQVFDSIQASLSKPPRLIGGFATKTTFINGFSSPIFTARAGVDYGNRIRMGAGISWLQLSNYEKGKDNTPFYLDKSFTDSSGPHTVHPALQFRYVNLFLDYVYYNSGRWQFSIPIQFGIGDSRYKYNFNGENIIESRKVIFLYEPDVSGQFKIMKWFGVGLDVGYRIMILSNKNIGTKFNSPVYDIKALIYWGELYKTVSRK
jgi:hypothetical protein